MPEPDVDFFDDDTPQPRGAGEDDLLETGGRRLPRWVVAVGSLLVLALVVAGVVATVRRANGRHDNHVAQRPTTADQPVGRPTQREKVFAVTAPVTPMIADATTAVMGFDRVFVVRLRQVTSVPLARSRETARDLSVAVPELTPARVADYRIVIDEPAGQVWLVAVGVRGPSVAVAFDSGTLRRMATMTLPAGVTGVAALGHQVYVSTDDTVLALSTRRAPERVPGASGPIEAITADPQRGRLLVIGRSAVAHVGTQPGTRIAALRPDGRDRAIADLTVAGARVGVAQGAIWLSGATTGDGTVVERLDVETLRPFFVVRDLQVALGRGAGIVAVGTRVVWLASHHDRAGGGLWCLEAFTGEVSEHVGLVPESVTSEISAAPAQSRSPEAYVVLGGVLSELQLEGCNG